MRNVNLYIHIYITNILKKCRMEDNYNFYNDILIKKIQLETQIVVVFFENWAFEK